MILPIYVYGQPVLRKEAEELTPDYPELKKLVEDMYETMHASEGVGLAAPQVGLAIRLVVIDADPLKDTYPELKGVTLTLVNPELDIITDGKKITRNEGCLSLPGLGEPVARYEKVRLNWLDENFVEHDEIVEGYLARVMQHEFDHLEGQMFIDHLSPLRKQMIKGKLNAMLKGKVQCSYKVKTVK